MAFSFSPDRQTAASDDRSSMLAVDGLPEEILVPITSGAFARGIAETLELLGLPAVFLDHGGHVLFANSVAKAFLRGPLRVRAQHLVAERKEDNRVLSDLIALAITEPKGGFRSARLPRAQLTLHVLPLGDRLATSGQLLSAIALIDTGHDPCVATMIQRMGARTANEGSLSAKP